MTDSISININKEIGQIKIAFLHQYFDPELVPRGDIGIGMNISGFFDKPDKGRAVSLIFLA